MSLDEKGFVIVDKYQNTTAESIFAVGDVIGKLELTPVAIAAGRRLSERLFNGQTEAHLDYDLVPTVILRTHQLQRSVFQKKLQSQNMAKKKSKYIVHALHQCTLH